MADTVQILYNGIDAFSPQPTPFVGVEEAGIYEDELWGRAETVTLQGLLTGCTFSGVYAAQQQLMQRWNQSYQTMQVWQTQNGVSGKVFQKDLVQVNSIQFNQARWYGALPYTINLTCYPSGLFSGAFGILSPQDTWSFVEQENATLAVTHSISCQPFNTSSGPSNALTNARNWAFGRTGINTWMYPALISGVSPANFCLLTQQETVDRFNGTYSLVENYTNDLARSGYGVIRYTTDIQSGSNLISVNLQGTAEGCNRNLSGTRAAFANIDKTAIAVKAYQYAFNRTDLNPTPVAQSFSEDPFTANISFNYSFDNSNLPDTWFDYAVDLNVGTNGFITAGIQGTVRARGGDVASKLARTTAYASGINLYNLVMPFYSGFDASAVVPLDPSFISNGQSNNQSDGTVQLNALFNNRQQVSPVLAQFIYTMSFTPSLAQVDSKPKLNGNGTYSVVNLNYGSRASFTIAGTAVVDRDYTGAQGILAVKNAAYNLFTQYGKFLNATLDQDTVTASRTDERILSFSFTWSFGPTNIIGPSSVSVISV